MLENNNSLGRCRTAVRANRLSTRSADNTFSKVALTIPDTGLSVTNCSNTPARIIVSPPGEIIQLQAS